MKGRSAAGVGTGGFGTGNLGMDTIPFKCNGHQVVSIVRAKGNAMVCGQGSLHGVGIRTDAEV